jgi:hypothetical protein
VCDDELTPMDIAIQEAKDNWLKEAKDNWLKECLRENLRLEEELDRAAEAWLQVRMYEEHDDNGPGIVRCPVCDGWTTMKWKNGVQLDVEVKHEERCQITWAMNRLS